MFGPGPVVLMRARRIGGLALLFLVSCSLTGCFLYYDSRWGQAKASQKRVAAHSMPSELRSDPIGGTSKADSAPSAAPEHLRIRAYATPHYAAALVDGEAQFAQSLSDANPTRSRTTCHFG